VTDERPGVDVRDSPAPTLAACVPGVRGDVDSRDVERTRDELPAVDDDRARNLDRAMGKLAREALGRLVLPSQEPVVGHGGPRGRRGYQPSCA
jgi:hypothetical protein